MTWLNPAAFLGLIALAIPILVHLFGRRIAKRHRFPSLRFLPDVRATPATRSRPSDLLLLVLRCGVVLAAVLGLAQPRWLERGGARDAVPVRLVLVDTSASMRRLTSEGGMAVDRARQLAQQVLDSAREGMVVETAQPGSNIAGAASWLAARSGLRELVIVSDFQVGALGDGHLASLPDGIGLSLRRTDIPPGAGAAVNDSGVVAVEAQGTMIRASWHTVRAGSVHPFTLLTATSDSAAARGMLDALRAFAPGTTASNRGLTIAFPGSPPTTTATGTLTASWQGDLVLALRANQLLSEAARSATISPSCEAPGAVVARNSSGLVLASITAGESGLVIHSCAEVGTVAGTALLAAATGALTPGLAFGEREPNVVPDESLRSWERPPTAFAPRGREETSPDGRWFWLAAIALLVVEQLIRRGRITNAISTDGKVDRERAA